jgi:hypothetical protein
MNFNKDGATYILLVIPTLFAITVIAQGLTKMEKKPIEGKVAVGAGIVFLILIGMTYFMFIR